MATVAISSCSNPLEEQIIGDWVLDKYEILHLDSICNVRAAEAKANTTKAIELTRHEIDSAKTPTERQAMLEKEKKLQDELNSYTPQSLKDEYTEISNQQIGKMTLSFQNNKLVQVKVAGSKDQQSGTWHVSNDTIVTLFDNQPAEILIVKDVSTNSLTLFSPALDERSVDLVMKFGKK